MYPFFTLVSGGVFGLLLGSFFSSFAVSNPRFISCQPITRQGSVAIGSHPLKRLEDTLEPSEIAHSQYPNQHGDRIQDGN
ncbi:hypothetical protein ACA910_021040 [Epithemia clementina (nom. ined.)]